MAGWPGGASGNARRAGQAFAGLAQRAAREEDRDLGAAERFVRYAAFY